MGKNKNGQKETKREIEESLKNFENGTEEFGATMQLSALEDKEEIEEKIDEEVDEEIIEESVDEAEEDVANVEEELPEEEEVQEEVQEDATETVEEETKGTKEEPATRAKTNKPKKKDSGLLAFLIVVLVLSCLALGFLVGKVLYEKDDDKKEDKPTEENSDKEE